MMAPNNFLVAVQTYQQANLATLQNLSPFISTFNKKFKNFQTETANLGQTVLFDKPPRLTSTNSLKVSWQAADQRVQSLVVDQQSSVGIEFTSQQFIFNDIDRYMKNFGRSAMAQLSTDIETNLASNCVSGPYRFYGDGVNPISSYGQLAQALAQFRNFGSVPGEVMGYVSDIVVPQIVNSGLNQFAMNRNNENANSWELWDMSRCKWYESNLLPVHTAGTAGQEALTLTVVSTTQDSTGAVIAITFSGVGASDSSAVQQYDKFQFQDGVSGQPNLRYLTWTGYKPSATSVQFMATAAAASTSGSQVTVSIYPPLQANSSNSRNLTYPIVAGMQCKVLPNHRAGMLVADNAAYLAMPQLPNQTPFDTGNAIDPETGATFRQYFGTQFAENEQGMVHDCIWGSTVVPEMCFGLIFPE